MSTQSLVPIEVDLIVSAVPVPVLVADYTPIIERFAGMEAREARDRLLEDDGLLNETLKQPVAVAASAEWIRLYGSPHSEEAPDLPDRHFSPADYPELHKSLVAQFTAPLFGITSQTFEHKAPTLFGDVTVRSHWRVIVHNGQPDWTRVVIVDLDVTDLRLAQKELQESLEIKQRLVASVSHEIRTPLASIVGFAQLLHDESDLSPDDRSEMVEMLVQQSSDITNIVDDLLVAAKTEQGQLEVSSVGVDLRAQAAQAVESMDYALREELEIPKTSAACIGDPARVRQIIRNLISNAKKYGGSDIEIRIEKRPDVGALIISDNGPEIDQEGREKIFDAYERGGRTATGVPSLGLGLHICRTLAHRMGGDLVYRYESGRSEFVLTLPLKPGES
ncbi:MAG: HAMP domain-containing sensor histidine kinase [Acidimicrobiia bacterium]|jgi:signal transduction histidine kinase